MINSDGLGYDPSDLNSFPYQANDPPFDATSLVIEDIELAAELNVFEVIADFCCPALEANRPFGAADYRTLDMALRLFTKLASDSGNAFESIAYPDLFGAALDQAITWERG